jgi:hypothetical protein
MLNNPLTKSYGDMKDKENRRKKQAALQSKINTLKNMQSGMSSSQLNNSNIANELNMLQQEYDRLGY